MATEITVPELGENIDEATVTGIRVQPGDHVEPEQPLMEVEAGKATLEIPAAVTGTVRQVRVQQGDTVQVGQAIAEIDTEEKDRTAENEEQPTESKTERIPVILPDEDRRPPRNTARETTEPAQVSPARHVPAAPSVRRFAREIGINVDTVKGSGPHGRVSIDDVKRHAREHNEAPVGGLMGAPALPNFGKWGPVRREKMSSIRYATAKQITLCWSIPRVTHFDKADITELDRLRKRYADRAQARGGKLTMAVMVTKVVASALRKFPRFNASVDMASREIVLKDYVNVGIAVATDRGLMVPVLRDADKKNMVQLAVEIDEVARKCREGSISPGELEGGTFTVTNLGAIGGTFFTPIINHPEVAILGLGRAGPTPIVRENEMDIGLILPLSLSYDHRVIDGADAARFVRWVAEAVEEPLLLSLEGE